MGRIQSNIGLITGVPIKETVDKLMELAARPRDLLVSRTKDLRDQQVAINSMTAMTIAIQLAARNLGKAALFNERTVTSSQPELLGAAKNGDPLPGTYRFTPVQQAQNQQLLSSGFGSADAAVGAGTFSLRFGGFVDEGLALEALNGGAGVQRGKIRITDRSGASEVIDLSTARTIDDVLRIINSTDTINVSASVTGDSIRLTDFTGQSVANLRVQEVGLGATAADLGLSGINVAASTATGADIVSLFNTLPLSRLNDGNGVQLRDGVDELEIQFRDGSSALTIDFGDFSGVGVDAPENPSVADLLRILNEADPARLQARISTDGDHLELIDLTAGASQFSVSSVQGGQAAEDLGFVDAAVAGTITGRRLIAGLKSTLLSTFQGGDGFGTLGAVQITDRSGASASVNLANARTLDDVLAAINASGLGISARVNRARNGLEIIDTTGAATSNLIIANGDGTNTATKFGIVTNAAVTSANSGSLQRQTMSSGTLLETLNQQQGVQSGSFTVTDTNGRTGAVNLAVAQPKTVGDVIDAINALNLGLEARINDAGDGIALVDTAGGSSKIIVTDAGSGRAAQDLGIAGESELEDVGGTPTQVINGSTTYEIELDTDDTLNDLVTKVNDLGIGVTASLFNEGGGLTPYRLALSSNVSGVRGALLIDTSDVDFQLQEAVAAQDAYLIVGSGQGSGFLASSPTNTFDEVVNGLALTVNGQLTLPVDVKVETTSKSLVTNAKLLVDKYNELIGKLKEFTKFDAESNTTGILFGTNEALRVETTLSGIMSRSFRGAGDIHSLEEVGIQIEDDGELHLDEAVLQNAYATRPEDVEAFFTTAEFGFAAKLDAAVERLSGVDNSLLVTRSSTLQEKIDSNTERIETLTQKLDRDRLALLNRFFQLENIVARMQTSLAAISNIQALTPIRLRDSQ